MTRLNSLLLLAIGAGVLVLLVVVVVTPRVSDELSSDSNPSDTSSATSISSPTPEVDDLTGKLLEVATGAITPLWGPDRHGGMLEFSADGRTLAFATRPNSASPPYTWQVFAVSLSHGPSQATLVGNGSVPKPSPDGKYLGFGANLSQTVWQLSVFQPDGGVQRLDPAAGEAHWSPNGRWLVYRSRYQADNRDTSVVAVETGTWSSRVLGLTYPCQCDYALAPLWSADSRWVVYRYAIERTTFAVEVESGHREIFGPGISPKAWAPQGATLATVEGGSLVLRDLDIDRVTTVGQDAVDGSEVSWSPDGRAIAFPQQANGEEWVGLVDRAGNELIRVDVPAQFIGWSGDSTHVALAPGRHNGRSNEGGIEIYNVVTGQKLQSLAAARGRAAWSPVGKVLAYASAPEEGLTPCRWPTITQSWQVHLLDLSADTDRSITSVQAGCHTGGPDLLWSPDGRFLAICEVCKLGL